ncbi:unnamed protein product, partial [Polarella glacialis]
VMLHEFVVGPLPFGRDSDDQVELLRQIMEDPILFPSYIQDEAAIGLVSGLLERTPELRLGASSRGATEIKEHPYFATLDWDALVSRQLPPPWAPDIDRLKEDWESDEEGDRILSPADGAATPPEPGMEWSEGF